MIDREHDLPITKQAEVLEISRGSVYYLPRPVSCADLAIMRRLDQLHLEFPFAGSRMLRGLLAAEGCKIGRRHVKTLMRKMGIEALYRRPRTTRPEPGHRVYPYLLRGLAITRPNQVWAMDITYIPMARGFVYLALVLDWATRRVLSWRLSITMEAAFCVETLEDALARHGRPEIFNTDQGSQFTGAAFTAVLAGNGIALGGEAAEDAGGREHTAEATHGRRHAGQRRAEGPLGKEVVTPGGNRKAVAHLVEAHGMSERRACKAIGCCRMTMRYRTTRTDDASLRRHMRAVAQERRRFRASSRRYHRQTGQIQRQGRTQNWIKLGGKVKFD